MHFHSANTLINIASNTTPLRTHVHPGFLEAHAQEVASLVLEAARRYMDKQLQRAVVVFSEQAAKRSSAFMKALASGIVKMASGKPVQQLGKRQMYTVLALSKVVVDSLDEETAKKALPKLVEVQLSLVNALAALEVPWKVSAWPHLISLNTYAQALCNIPVPACSYT